jgi:proteasome component ECM29
MRSLLSDLGGGQWRVREAAAAALSDLLQGRRWAELAPHFEALWTMTLRWAASPIKDV